MRPSPLGHVAAGPASGSRASDARAPARPAVEMSCTHTYWRASWCHVPSPSGSRPAGAGLADLVVRVAIEHVASAAHRLGRRPARLRLSGRECWSPGSSPPGCSSSSSFRMVHRCSAIQPRRHERRPADRGRDDRRPTSLPRARRAGSAGRARARPRSRATAAPTMLDAFASIAIRSARNGLTGARRGAARRAADRQRERDDDRAEQDEEDRQRDGRGERRASRRGQRLVEQESGRDAERRGDDRGCRRRCASRRRPQPLRAGRRRGRRPEARHPDRATARARARSRARRPAGAAASSTGRRC